MNKKEKEAIIEMIAKGNDIQFIRMIAKVASKRIAMEDAILQISEEFVLPQQ